MSEIIAMKDPRGYLTPEEMYKIKNACINIRDKCIISILIDTGVRVSELLSIKKEDINYRTGEIIVPILKKRNKRERIVEVRSETIELIKQYSNIIKTNNLFPISRVNVFRIVRKLGEITRINYIGKKRIHPHHFRHGFAMNGIKKGISIQIMQQLLGHSNISATTSYLQYGSKDLSEARKKIWE